MKSPEAWQGRAKNGRRGLLATENHDEPPVGSSTGALTDGAKPSFGEDLAYNAGREWCKHSSTWVVLL